MIAPDTPRVAHDRPAMVDLSAALAANAARTASPALIHDGVVISHAELSRRVAALAARLGPEPVGVYVSRTPETVIAVLAVLAAGGVHCPVDPAFPTERRETMLAAAGCKTVLLTADGQPTPDGLNTLDVRSAGSESVPDRSMRHSPDAAAYLLFTSGSTGRPKPVVTSRRAISVAVAALRELFDITTTDRVLQFASLNWDTCFEEILPTLTAGASLVIDAEAHTGSFPRFLRMCADRGVTVLDLPTAYWHELVRHLDESGDHLPGSIRLVVIGGEAASPRAVADWHRLVGDRVRLLNTYGCTETTLITHSAELAGPAADVPIGHPLPHVRERVGEDGELLIGGPALADGYLDDPNGTARRFVLVNGERYFRTGDRVRRDPSGALIHNGRIDGELKIRGVRVDPAEVEALIVDHPTVAAAAVVGDRIADRTVLAAYVVSTTEDLDPAALRSDLLADLRTRAPAHLRPGRVTVVPQLARTASGKVDRAATHRRYVPTRAGRRHE